MYEEKIKLFISKIKISNESDDLYKLIEKTFLYLFRVNEEHANSTLDALLLIADNSEFNIKYSEKSQFVINFDERRIIIRLLKDEINEFGLIHELEHVIHYYGARIYDPIFLEKLLNNISTGEFIKKMESIINRILLPIIDKCTRLTTLNKNNKLLNIDDNDIKKYMIENEYDNEMIEFVLKSRISFEEYVQLSQEEEEKQYAYKTMERLYPAYFSFYGLIDNMVRGRVNEFLPDVPFTYGHPKEYFEKNDNVMWFSEIIATYEEIRVSKDAEVINQLLLELLGEELYSKLIMYSKYYRELTKDNFKKEERMLNNGWVYLYYNRKEI